ncbi:hypothetical protein OAO01_08335, partial [Oligoflexia bacterium]|nr:hypothetical protein [Oligoflexia bacterium]
YTCPVFGEVSVETVTFKVDKERTHHKIRVYHSDSIHDSTVGSATAIPVKTCIKNPDFLVPINWSKEVSEIVDHINDVSFSIVDKASPFVPLIALQAYSFGKGKPPQSKADVKNHIYHTTSKTDESTYPYLEGADIHRYHSTWSGKYLRHGACLAEPQTIERFIGPRILIREITSPAPYVLTACYVDEPYLYNKSVLHILPKAKANEELMLALLAVLNSRFASFLITYLGRKSQRKIFPKIVNDDLKYFPIPVNFYEYVTTLAQYSREMARLHEHLREAGETLERAEWNQAAPASDNEIAQQIFNLQKELDIEVYKAYGLKNSHVENLEKAC